MEECTLLSDVAALSSLEPTDMIMAAVRAAAEEIAVGEGPLHAVTIILLLSLSFTLLLLQPAAATVAPLWWAELLPTNAAAVAFWSA